MSAVGNHVGHGASADAADPPGHFFFLQGLALPLDVIFRGAFRFVSEDQWRRHAGNVEFSGLTDIVVCGFGHDGVAGNFLVADVLSFVKP